MLVENIKLPVVVFNVDDFDLEKEKFFLETKQFFNNLEWDYYDMRKMQINFLQKSISKDLWKTIPLELLVDYYCGKKDISSLNFLIKHLSETEYKYFQKISPFRRRSIAEFIITNLNNNWEIERIPAKQFVQIDAKINGLADELDYRKYPRIFAETSNEAVESISFQHLIKGIANILKSNFNNVKKLNIVAHHTYVEATSEHMGNNSPEGIHQDGYDYIVSALVVERKNITGGISQIFGGDKKTRLLASQLMPGQGILQPDKGTNLWHNVTPFSVVGEGKGHRSSIGFDINILQ